MGFGGMWRRAATALGVVLVLLGTAGCGDRRNAAESTGAERDTAAILSRYEDLGAVPEKLGADGVSIVVGSPDAPITLTLYEEPRCPACRDFEVNGAGPDLRRLLVEGKVRIEYHLDSFLDRDGSGASKRAMNALRAALEKDLFVEYHEVLYFAQGTPQAFGFSNETLLRLAEQVPGLRGKKFDAAVKDLKYAQYVTDSGRKADERGFKSTPTLLINGGGIPEDQGGVLFTPGIIETYFDLYITHDGDIPL